MAQKTNYSVQVHFFLLQVVEGEKIKISRSTDSSRISNHYTGAHLLQKRNSTQIRIKSRAFLRIVLSSEKCDTRRSALRIKRQQPPPPTPTYYFNRKKGISRVSTLMDGEGEAEWEKKYSHITFENIRSPSIVRGALSSSPKPKRRIFLGSDADLNAHSPVHAGPRVKIWKAKILSIQAHLAVRKGDCK